MYSRPKEAPTRNEDQSMLGENALENHWIRPDSVDPWETQQATGVE